MRLKEEGKLNLDDPVSKYLPAYEKMRVMENGALRVGKMYRGSMEKTILDYVRGRLETVTDIQYDRIFVTHSPMDSAVVDKAIALVKELHPFDEVIEADAGCTICSHCGPNCLGLLFFKKA